jgi:hypothetical protein
MKRYLLFHYDQYYPGGGWSDFFSSFDNPEQAKQFWMAHKEDRCQYYELIDTAKEDGEKIDFPEPPTWWDEEKQVH